MGHTGVHRLIGTSSSNISLLATILAVILPGTYLLLRYLSAKIGPKSLANTPPLPPPTRIVDLRIYPIKSCRGFSVPSAKLLKAGLDLDRNWMFVTAADHKFLTIRTNPKMTLIETSFDADNDTLRISIKNHPASAGIAIPAHPTRAWLNANTTPCAAEIWSQETDAWAYASELTQPLAAFLALDVRLVYKGPTPRVLRGSGAPDRLGRTADTRFADMMPVLVGSRASLAELNQRLQSEGEAEIGIERFRPNVVVEGGEPWNEDVWKTLRISGAGATLVLDVACRCLRCQVPNVDPETAEKHPRQPWKLLTSYRRIDRGLKGKPAFGMLCVPREEGTVEVGMCLEVLETTHDHFFVSPMK
ncbi:uncharacterized protein K452DRAFT_276772 [Aplosporella prunicola CBS 121167]|uniref:MOSC domain-containing protein n=1 Tax=Aplosporella prunicola CBS 121167 TaxID=1176127 RepID=A0A6A6B460_9PEZI|nr:uncharacterized protein K452DRAFT_276772 [Aplosporella prunicola CBS 121167]KAF2138408.1 hypothetical protein K452DRAFT_276772 [Aplosporella prunicola CBS 121167]